MTAAPFKNRILRSLDPETITRLELKPITLQSGREIENPGETIEHLIFIEDGIGSMTNTFKDGFQVEVGMFGVESVMGASALIGTRLSLNKVYMQMSGYGLSCRMPLATLEFQRFGRFHDLVLRSVQAIFVQACQSAGCNAHHNLAQRLSRWLLLCSDRSESLTLSLTHEYLADMLGSNRSTVSVAAEHLQNEGLIRYSRGKVVILDRPGLEQRACECYRAVRDHLANYLEVEQN
jgi:Crp-like helix-turn-helix domain